MIYILTGVAKSGKTLVSEYVKSKYQIKVISTDDMMLEKYHQSHDIDIHASDSTVANQLEPYLREYIKHHIDQTDDLLIEGVHFNPLFANELTNQYPNHIRIIYMGYKDQLSQNKVKELYRHKNKMKNQWIFDDYEEQIEEVVQYLISESQRIYEACLKYGLTYIEIDDINKQKDQIHDILFQ
jgi:2-phosphoglycerate kinase